MFDGLGTPNSLTLGMSAFVEEDSREDTFRSLWERAMGVTATEGSNEEYEDGAAAAAATLATAAWAAMISCAPSRS